MVATLTRTLGPRHLTLAEDAVQDALITAMQQWPFRGIPENPEAWLFQVARNRALDRLRHGKMAVDKEPAIARESAAVESPSAAPLLRHELPPLEDDQLGLAVPHLPPVARRRRTRRARIETGRRVQRRRDRAGVSRAGVGDRAASRPGEAPRCATSRSPSACPTRAIFPRGSIRCSIPLYLMFNEGYAATSGDQMIRDDVAAEAIRLAHMIAMHPAISAPAGVGAGVADAAACRALSRPGRFRGHAVPAARSGPRQVGPRDDRRRHARARSRLGRRANHGLPPRGRHRRVPRGRGRRGNRPTGRRLSSSTTSCWRSPGRRWWR